MRNVIGRENEVTHAVRTEYSCDSFVADRMGLDGTMIHHLAVRKATESYGKRTQTCTFENHANLHAYLAN